MKKIPTITSTSKTTAKQSTSTTTKTMEVQKKPTIAEKKPTIPEKKPTVIADKKPVAVDKKPVVVNKKPVVDEKKGPNNKDAPAGKVVLNTEVIEAALNTHNNLRKLHNTPPLKHNPELSQIAQAYANHLASTDTFEHSKNNYKGQWMGENLYSCMGMPATGEAMTRSWYSEIKFYDWAKPGFGMKTGHFTQVIWKETEEAGFGVAISKSGNYYAVGNYFPGGNMMGAFPENVLPLSKQTKDEEVKLQKHDETKDSKNQGNIIKNQGVKEKGEEETKAEPKSEKTNINLPFITEALARHNFLRQKHGVPELKHNEELSKIAQAWAESMLEKGDLNHSENTFNGKPLGENIAMCGGKKMTGEYMTNMWYDEVKKYKYENPTFNGTGHFTQVVWKNTTDVGFGIATKNNEWYAVGNYFPAGNYRGQNAQNVFPPKK